MAIEAHNPFLYIADPTKGRPLFNADLYYGIADLDPEVPANQVGVSVVQEDGTVVSVPQPITTGPGGVPLYNGSPVQVCVSASEYSFKALDKNDSQTYYFPRVKSSAKLSETLIVFDTLQDCLDSENLSDGLTAYVTGRNSVSDGGGNVYRIWPKGTAQSYDDGKWIYNPTSDVDMEGTFPGGVLRTSQFGKTGTTPVPIYVSTAGNDSNNGFASSTPLLTVQGAIDFLQSFGRRFEGAFEIQLSAGTYGAGGVLSSGSIFTFPLVFRGPDVGGAPNVPTAIIDVTGDPTADVFQFARQNWAQIIDIYVQNASNGNAVVNNGGSLTLTNLHTFNCFTTLASLHTALTNVFGGVWDGNNIVNSIGYNSFYNSTHNFTQTTSDPASGALLVKNYARGFLINEGVQGHIDRVNITDCTGSAINIKRGAGAVNTSGVVIKRSNVGILAENNGWFNNNIVFGTGADANTVNVRTLGSSPELSYLTNVNSSRTMRIIENTSISVHTGTTVETTVFETGEVPDWVISEGGNVAKFVYSGSCSLAGDATIRIAIDTGVDTSIISRQIKTGASKFYIEAYFRYSPTQIRSSIDVGDNIGNYDVTTNISAIPTLFNVSHTIKTKLTLANAGDSVTIENVIYEGTFGG